MGRDGKIWDDHRIITKEKNMSYELKGTMTLKEDINMIKLNTLLNEQELFGFYISDNAIDIQRCSNVYQEEEILKFLQVLAPYIIEGIVQCEGKDFEDWDFIYDPYDEKWEVNRPEYVETNIGKIPLEDYREIRAMQCGFDSYEDMLKEGYCISVE